jgi:hypothetical protein
VECVIGGAVDAFLVQPVQACRGGSGSIEATSRACVKAISGLIAVGKVAQVGRIARTVQFADATTLLASQPGSINFLARSGRQQARHLDNRPDAITTLAKQQRAGAAKAGVRGGESAAARYGREVHEAYDYGPGFVKEYRGLPSGRRPDAVNFETREVVELKPNTPGAISRGRRQLEIYRRELQEEFPGQPWRTRLETYAPYRGPR